MSHQSALGRVKGLGSAHSGSRQWFLQKVSAVLLAVLFIWFSICFAKYINADYEVVQAWIKKPLTSVLLITLIVAGIYHGIVGLQMVIDDYVSQTCKRLIITGAVKVILSMIGVGAIVAVLKVALG